MGTGAQSEVKSMSAKENTVMLIMTGDNFFVHSNYCKSLKFCAMFISRMNCFHEIKYHTNVLAVHCNNETAQNCAKLNSNELTFMGKTTKYKAFTVVYSLDNL